MRKIFDQTSEPLEYLSCFCSRKREVFCVGGAKRLTRLYRSVAGVGRKCRNRKDGKASFEVFFFGFFDNYDWRLRFTLGNELSALTEAQGTVKPNVMADSSGFSFMRPSNTPVFSVRRIFPTRSLVHGLCALGLISTLAVSAWAQTKVGIVDTQRAMMETEDGLRMQANIKKIFDTKQKQLEVKQKELERERADIEKQQNVLSQEALRRRAEDWQREMAGLQQMSVTYNQELQKKQSELTQPIIQKTMRLIRRIATSEGYDMVVDKQAVPYARGDLDITDRVITLYNGGAGSSPATAPTSGSDKAPATKAPAKKAPAKKAPAKKAPATK